MALVGGTLSPPPHFSWEAKGRRTLALFFQHKKFDAPDQEGIELTDLETARAEALKDIVDIKTCRSDMFSDQWTEWSIEVCNEQGDVLLVVPFSPN